MNKETRNESVEHILYVINITKEELLSDEVQFNSSLNKAEELIISLEELSLQSIFDIEEFQYEFYEDFFENKLADAYHFISEFRDEIQELLHESPSKDADKIESQYSDLDEVLGKFSYSEMRYETIENCIEHIDEAIGLLRKMLV